MKIAADKRLWLATILFAIVVLGLIVRAGVANRRAPSAKTLEQLPTVMLWAWERPEQLSFINPNNIGVAFLAKTITLHGNNIDARPRLQPLYIPTGTKLVAVVRIETDRRQPPTLNSQQLQQTLSELISTSNREGLLGLQIDFDATVSQRQFYRDLLNRLRQSLPATCSLSITALASWCARDAWLEDLPVDEAIPMLFRLGVDKRQFQSGYQFTSTPCQDSAGISTDEPVAVREVRRLYIFNPRPWSQETLNKTLEAYNR